MQQKSLGLIETQGLIAGIEAADAAVKSANVQLVGYELTKGGGWTTVKVQGDVGAVNAAVSAAAAAAAKVGRVVSTRVIPRPAAGIECLIHNRDTVGDRPPEPPEPPKGPEPTEPEPPVSPEPPTQEAQHATEAPEEEPEEPPAPEAEPVPQVTAVPAMEEESAPTEEPVPAEAAATEEKRTPKPAPKGRKKR